MPQPVERLADPAAGAAAPAASATDDEVIQRILAGDRSAFELIMRRYNQRLFRVVRSILGDDAEAEDAVQEAYLRAYRHLGQFEGRSKFSTWLTKIAVYEAAARGRRRRRLRVVSLPDAGSGAAAPRSARREPADEASGKELRELLAAAVEALPPELRTVFVLRMVERLSTNETARCLDLSPANVKVRLHRARALLRSWIDERIGQQARQLYAFAGARCDRIVENVMSRLPAE